jgi:hypothetical protein
MESSQLVLRRRDMMEISEHNNQLMNANHGGMRVDVKFHRTSQLLCMQLHFDLCVFIQILTNECTFPIHV